MDPCGGHRCDHCVVCNAGTCCMKGKKKGFENEEVLINRRKGAPKGQPSQPVPLTQNV